jgi:hypothetical protein
VTGGSPARRGRIGLYALAFALMLGAAVTIAVASLEKLESTRLLWVSMGLSYAAIVFALLALLVPRRHA